jgi:hypothetical protein
MARTFRERALFSLQAEDLLRERRRWPVVSSEERVDWRRGESGVPLARKIDSPRRFGDRRASERTRSHGLANPPDARRAHTPGGNAAVATILGASG